MTLESKLARLAVFFVIVLSAVLGLLVMWGDHLYRQALADEQASRTTIEAVVIQHYDVQIVTPPNPGERNQSFRTAFRISVQYTNSIETETLDLDEELWGTLMEGKTYTFEVFTRYPMGSYQYRRVLTAVPVH